jgi:hypothetical protein
VLLGAEGEGVDVDTSVGVASVVLVGLDNVEVGTFTLRETILAVELELGSDDGVETPAVHIEGSLGEDECTSIGHEGTSVDTQLTGSTLGSKGLVCSGRVSRSSVTSTNITSTCILEETTRNESRNTRDLSGSTECVDGIGKGINGIGVVEGLGTECAEKGGVADEGRAIVDVGIRLDDPEKLLARVVEVELDLVGGRTDGLVTSELELLNEVLVGVLCHLAALISVKEDVVDVERGSNKGLLVSSWDGDVEASSSAKIADGPEALTDGAEIDVDLNFVVLYETTCTLPFGIFIGILNSINNYIENLCQGLDYILSHH